MIRDEFVLKLEKDLVGPGSVDEVIGDRPGDRYLTGILFPPRTKLGPDQDDDAESSGDAEAGGAGAEAIASTNIMRPSTAGLSFAIRPALGSPAVITLIVSGARYEGLTEAEDVGSTPQTWRRRPFSITLEEVILGDAGDETVDLGAYGLPDVSLYLRTSRLENLVLVTVAVSNAAQLGTQPRRRAVEEATLFQFALEVSGAAGSTLHQRPVGGGRRDEDGLSAELIYRNAAEYAVGHVCSATWDQSGGPVGTVRTTWVPTAIVKGMSAQGDPACFAPLFGDPAIRPLSARWLADCNDRDLDEGLSRLVAGYAHWIETMRVRSLDAGIVPERLRPNAKDNLDRCDRALVRMGLGLQELRASADARLAFRLANRAMEEQRQWATNSALEWYPFQLAFSLLCLESQAQPESDDREVMDLLWFPTGGGKTEAYLLLTAFTIFLRRLRATRPEEGGGVTVFMRYTLRLLTVQQFQRASALICACELIRVGRIGVQQQTLPPSLIEGPPISIGLWVGDASTPNRVETAITALENRAESTPAQLTECPCCTRPLKWKPSADRSRITVRCENASCLLSEAFPHLPVWTVDEDLYAEQPSLVIATADKYAQIARFARTGLLFGIGTAAPPPELVIQDELHLISGPLGTMAGLYEIAIDELCRSKGARPKVIGSTATIRRAKEQVRALFDREAFQFPPPGIDHDNSGFAVSDNVNAGRLYLGVSTAGRSAKYTLQAVSASLLQAASAPHLTRAQADPYWTLVLYFNSLRELGGSLVLMQDDVVKSISELARREGTPPRPNPEVVELNSRIASSAIPGILDRLKRAAGHADAVDVVLASNMISVGMDVPRLGLMLMNGQPKGIAEYIQASSRVGRGSTAGLVVTVYNAGKSRDRSHFETFSTWHQSLYRDVEATSVTPYAARARDRALHAPLVAMARHLIDGLGGDKANISDHEGELESLIDGIVERAARCDKREALGVRRQLEMRLDQWLARGDVAYWDDSKPDLTLMVSAEAMAARSANGRGAGAAWPTPNSLRDVEASAEYVLMRDIEEDCA